MLSLQTVLPDTLELLRRLMSVTAFDSLRLVGGTALALQYGHRRSVDLDMFGILEPDTDRVTSALAGMGVVDPGTCSTKIKTYRIDGIKVDFVDYSRYPWLDAPVIEGHLRLASPRDIAAMKINAILGRGSRKDFVDMYFLMQHYTLEEIIGFYKLKYPEHSEYRAMLSLTYFDDAELLPMPLMFENVAWSDMKCYILEEVEKYNRSHVC
ncbi:MAG: nucleotidyl transferase AbiEii/AbiGii toxin family protein [Prevotella sp.]|nr:nucleotidyl transferase AbiEii/AbiGii toxin family protein [Prevotella sp.]